MIDLVAIALGVYVALSIRRLWREIDDPWRRARRPPPIARARRDRRADISRALDRARAREARP